MKGMKRMTEDKRSATVERHDTTGKPSIKACLASLSDLPDLLLLYQHAKRDMQSRGIDQWDAIYPKEDTLRADILLRNLYVCREDTELLAAFALNQDCDREYSEGQWKGEDDSFLVLHRLCVNPMRQGRGVGAAAMRCVEAIARQQGGTALRLDAFSQNPAALQLYQKLGYQKVGSVCFRKGQFSLFEKVL